MKVINKKIFSRKPKAILIDIDNTLYAYEPSHKSAIAAVAENYIWSFLLIARSLLHTISRRGSRSSKD